MATEESSTPGANEIETSSSNQPATPTGQAQMQTHAEPRDDNKNSAKKQKTNAASVKKEEEERIKQTMAKVEAFITKSGRRIRIKLTDCRRADFQRDIDEKHVEALMRAHIDQKIKLHRELIIVMSDLAGQCKYVIIDGQHRWTALKKISRQSSSNGGSQRTTGTPTSGDLSELTSIDAVLMPRECTVEDQQIAANLGDRSNRPNLPFSNLDLVNEVKRLQKSNTFFAGLKVTRHNMSIPLSIARLYNPRIQEFHLIIACVYSDEGRAPLLDLMKAIDDGKLTKSGNGSVKNSTVLWRKIYPFYDPALEHNVQIIRSIALEFLIKFDSFLSNLASEGSRIRLWLNEHGRNQVKVLDFMETLGLEKIGNKGLSFADVYSFLNSSCTGEEVDDEIIKKANARFAAHIQLNVNKLSIILSKLPPFAIDFIYVDLRLFDTSYDKIIGWMQNSTPTYRLIRNLNATPELLEENSPKSFHANVYLATLILVDLNFPSNHSLRKSFIHVFSSYNAENFTDGHELMTLGELVGNLLKGYVGVCFIAQFDLKNYSELVKNGLHSFVTSKGNSTIIMDDGDRKSDGD